MSALWATLRTNSKIRVFLTGEKRQRLCGRLFERKGKNYLAIIKLVLHYALNAVILLILLRCILSWIPGLYNRFVQVVYKLTDPILVPVQKLIDKLMGGRPMMIDLSPIVVFFIIQFLIRPLLYML